jgi:hypothetical protein
MHVPIALQGVPPTSSFLRPVVVVPWLARLLLLCCCSFPCDFACSCSCSILPAPAPSCLLWCCILP